MGLREITVHEKLRDKNVVLANCLAKDQTFPTYIPDDYHGQYFAIKHVIEKVIGIRYVFIYPKIPLQALFAVKRSKMLGKMPAYLCHHCANTRCYLAMNITVM